MNIKERIKRAQDSRALSAITATPEERAITLDQLFQQLNLYAYSYDGLYFVTVYIDQGLMYALFNASGELYRSAIMISADGGVALGEFELVIQEFAPVAQRAQFTITRQADGRARFVMIAGTAIINRSGEIDSTKLFDNMIRRAEETGAYPKLDFYHMGEIDPAFEFGQFDLLAREGVCYIGSGLLDENHPLADAMVRAWEHEPEKWGASIEFYPILESVEYLTVARGLDIAVFNDGINTRISVLPESDAAHFFTAIPVMETRAMNDREKEALKKFINSDQKYGAFMSQIEDINRSVKDRGLITRGGATQAAPATPPAQAAAPAPTPEAAPVLESSFDLDDAAIDAIARSSAMGDVINAALGPVLAQINGLLEKVNSISEDVTGLDNAAVAINERLTGLEVDEEEKQRTWAGDLPARRHVAVSYRPRDAHNNGAQEITTLADAADMAREKTRAK